MIPKNAGVDNEVSVQGHDSKGKKRESRKFEENEWGTDNKKENAQPTQPNKPDQE